MDTTITYSAPVSQETLRSSIFGCCGRLDGRGRFRRGPGDITLYSPCERCLAMHFTLAAVVRDMYFLCGARLGTVDRSESGVLSSPSAFLGRGEQFYCFSGVWCPEASSSSSDSRLDIKESGNVQGMAASWLFGGCGGVITGIPTIIGVAAREFARENCEWSAYTVSRYCGAAVNAASEGSQAWIDSRTDPSEVVSSMFSPMERNRTSKASCARPR